MNRKPHAKVERERTHFINTDLVIVAPIDPQPLIDGFAALGMHHLGVWQNDDGTWGATFEVSNFLHATRLKDAEWTVEKMVRIIEKLEGEALCIWQSCSLREIDIGFQGGHKSLESTISNGTLARVATLGACLKITIYGASIL